MSVWRRAFLGSSETGRAFGEGTGRGPRPCGSQKRGLWGFKNSAAALTCCSGGVFVPGDGAAEEFPLPDPVEGDWQWDRVGVIGRCPFVEGSMGSSSVVVVGELVQDDAAASLNSAENVL